MKAILFTLLLSAGLVHAEEKVCQVTGMHCSGCTENVEGKVCGDGSKFATCKATIIDAKKEIGEIHLVTKDPAGKIDEGAVKTAVKDAGYVFKACKAASGKGKETAAPKAG